MFGGKNKDIITTSTLSVSLVEYEHVNVCWDVIKTLLNDFWSSLKMLCSKNALFFFNKFLFLFSSNLQTLNYKF